MSKFRLSRETWRFLRVNFPLCSDRFIENLLIIGLNRQGFNDRQLLAAADEDAREKLVRKALKSGRSAQADRRDLLDRYRSGDLGLKPALRIAIKNFDNDRDLLLFLKSLSRKEKTEKYEVPIDVAICYLDDVGTLTCTAEKAAKHVTSFLHRLGSPILSKKEGLPRNLTAGAYRKQIERLRRIGVKLLCAKQKM